MRKAIAFLTPLGGPATPSPAALRAFPAVGAAMGAVLGCGWWAAAKLWPRPVAGALVVVADLALTGMLHIDGLADSADGLLPHMERGRRLDVMAAPDVGAFGATAVAATLLLRWVALATLSPSVPLLAGLWCASRTAMAVTTLTQPYVGGGLATAFLPPAGERASLSVVITSLGLVASAVLVALWHVVGGLVALGALCVGATAVVAFARVKIGGFTGDVLGAAGVVSETLALVVASAKW